MAYVYKHIRNDTNEVFYIGIGKNKKRTNSKLSRNQLWINIVNKVGYRYEIIEDELSWETACEREKYWIKYHGRRDLNTGPLVNMTEGGEGFYGLVRSDSHKKKISISKTGIVFSETHKENLKKARKKIMTDEFRQEIGKRAKNISDQTRQKMSNSAKKRVKNRVSCKYCGKVLLDTHLTQHYAGKICKEKQND